MVDDDVRHRGGRIGAHHNFEWVGLQLVVHDVAQGAARIEVLIVPGLENQRVLAVSLRGEVVGHRAVSKVVAVGREPVVEDVGLQRVVVDGQAQIMPHTVTQIGNVHRVGEMGVEVRRGVDGAAVAEVLRVEIDEEVGAIGEVVEIVAHAAHGEVGAGAGSLHRLLLIEGVEDQAA